MTIKRIAAGFLFFFLVFLVSCENIESSVDQSTVSEEESLQDDEEASNLPVTRDFEDSEFVVAVSDEMAMAFSPDEEGENIVGAAVRKRNQLIEDKYNATLKTKLVNIDTAEEEIKNSLLSGTQFADLLSLPGNILASLVEQECLFNLLSSEDFNIENSYINTEAAKKLALNNSLYVLYDSTTQYFDNAWAVFYDKELMKNNGLSDPTLLVSSGDWTWDRFLEYSELIAYKVMTKGSSDLKTDIFGFGAFRPDTELPLVMWESCGFSMFGETYGQTVSVKADIDEIKEITDYMKNIYNNKSRYSLQHSDVSDAFDEGRLGFYIQKLEYCSAIADSEREWGIIPLPQLNKEQPNYCSFIDPKGPALAVPSNVFEPKKSIFLLNAFSAASDNSIKKAVYDKYVNLFLRNNSSTIMLEDIFSTLYFDPAALYGSGIESFSKATTDVVIEAIVNNGPISVMDKLKESFLEYSSEKFK